MVEAVWGEHKSAAQIVAIAAELLAAGETVLVTRVSPEKAEAVLAEVERLAAVPGAATVDGAAMVGVATVGVATVAGAAEGQPERQVGDAAVLSPEDQHGETPSGAPEAQARHASAARQAGQGASPGSLTYHPQAACLCSPLPDPSAELGRVVVLGGGSSDLTVASEALLALRAHRVPCELLLDVGVAGLHRLLERLGQLRDARVLIACAGMEGALPTVLGGLVPQPVIGVPVSVGYGVSAGGVAALHGMLASCAPGLVVVNIDNGYGAAMAALRMLGTLH
jgi:NCAIR mutase (PurE)-related protein